MKNKSFLVILSLIVLGAIGYGAVKTKDYYDSRYVENDAYYVRVPNNQSTTIVDLLDDSGKKFDRGRDYEFTGYNEKEESRILTFSYTTEDPEKLIQPGTYLKISASKDIVLGQEVIQQSDVPKNVLELIK